MMQTDMDMDNEQRLTIAAYLAAARRREEVALCGAMLDMLDTDGSPDAYRDMTPVDAREGDGYGRREWMYMAGAVFAFAFVFLGFVAFLATYQKGA